MSSSTLAKTAPSVGDATLPDMPSSTGTTSASSSSTTKEKPLTLQQFRILVGLPPDPQTQASHVNSIFGIFGSGSNSNAHAESANVDAHNAATTAGQSNTTVIPPSSLAPLPRHSVFNLLGTKLPDIEALRNEARGSMYFTIVTTERRQRALYFYYDLLTYTCLILQLVIASVLIILGALGGDTHIGVAVLGAVTGVITGILSLIRGQGLPNRLLMYAESLRRVREHIDFVDRELRTQTRAIYLSDVETIFNEYTAAQAENNANRPDVWTSMSFPTMNKSDGVMNAHVNARNGATALFATPVPSARRVPGDVLVHV